MNQATTILDIEQQGELLIVKPVLGLHDLDESALEGTAHELLERLDHSGATEVFLDLHGTDAGPTHQILSRFPSPRRTSSKKCKSTAARTRLQARLFFSGCCFSKLRATRRQAARFSAP